MEARSVSIETDATGSTEEQVLALYRQHGRQLFGYALGMLGQRADAEDAVQEAFLRLKRHLDDAGAADNLRAWLYRVVTNLSRDAQRSRRRWLDRGGDATSSMATVAPVTVERIALERVLAQLEPRQRELVLMRGMGLSYAEMAAAAHLRPSSVGTLLARSVARFTELFQRELGKENQS